MIKRSCDQTQRPLQVTFVRTKVQLAKHDSGWQQRPFLSPWGALKPIDAQQTHRGRKMA